MKRINQLILFLLALTFTTSLLAQEAPPAGLSKFGAETVDTINASGLVRLNGTTVRHLTQVSGSFLATSARLSALEIYGEANFTNSTVTEPSTIIGYLRAQSSSFQALLTLGAQKATFTTSQIHSLLIRKDDTYKGKQVIELKQGTVVNGPITFESGKGEVHVYPPSKVLGPISGGKIIKKT